MSERKKCVASVRYAECTANTPANADSGNVKMSATTALAYFGKASCVVSCFRNVLHECRTSYAGGSIVQTFSCMS